MPRVVHDGTTYEDGEYEGFCPSCKLHIYFEGIVRLTNTGRVLATGPCPVCSTTITKVLVY